MTKCEEQKIAEYNRGQLSGAELLSVSEHLKECPTCSSYQKKNEALNKLLNSWEEKVEFSKSFDTELLTKAYSISKNQQRLSFAFTSVWKTAVAFCLMLVVITVYKNTLFDSSLQNLKDISKAEFTSKTDIKDFKLFATQRLCRELADANSDQKTLMSYELMLAVPENILLAEQKYKN